MENLLEAEMDALVESKVYPNREELNFELFLEQNLILKLKVP